MSKSILWEIGRNVLHTLCNERYGKRRVRILEIQNSLGTLTMRSKKLSRTINRISVACLVFAGFTSSANSQISHQPPKDIDLRALSVRILPEQEARKRAPDVIGVNLVVRLRLTNNGSHGIYFCSWQDSIIPVGYSVKEESTGVTWLWGKSGNEKESPGLDKGTFGQPITWLLLSPGTAVEWEVLDSTSGKTANRAFTIFVKEDLRNHPREIFSDFVSLPAISITR